MASLREMVDGKTLCAANVKADLFDHVKKAAHSKADYDVSKAKLATKLAPMQSLINLSQQMHGPNPQDPSDPFQNPYMQQGMGGPGGTDQGMENQDDLARTGQMMKPQLGQDPNNYLAKQSKGIPGQPNGDGNKKLQTPGQNLKQGKAPQRSTSGQKPGKVSQATDGKPVKKGKSIKLEISDDKMAAGGPGSGRRPGAGVLKTGLMSKLPNDYKPKGTDPHMGRFDRSQTGHDQELKDSRAVKKGVPQGEKIDWRKYSVNPDLPNMSASRRARMEAEAIKNGMKRCKTCKNFFNPTHPKAGKSHCPNCKSGSIAAARSAGRKPGSFRRLNAGGPGSGRKSEGYTDNPLSHGTEAISLDDAYQNRHDGRPPEDFSFTEAYKKAEAEDAKFQTKPGQKLKYYDGPMNATNTTTKRGKKVLTTGDYHNNAGKSMPSVAIGLLAGHAQRKKWIAAKTGRPSIGPFPSSLVK